MKALNRAIEIKTSNSKREKSKSEGRREGEKEKECLHVVKCYTQSILL